MKRAAYVAAAAQLRLNGGPARKSYQFALKRIRRDARSTVSFRNLVLTAFRGSPRPKIAEAIGCDRDTLRRWLYGIGAAPLEVVETAERRLARRLIEIDEQAAKDRAAVAVAAQDAKVLKAEARVTSPLPRGKPLR